MAITIVNRSKYAMILCIQHIDLEGPETLGACFSEHGYNLGICNLHRGDKLPADLSGLDAVVSLGGPMNVYEEKEYPFLVDEDRFLKQVIAGKVPFLGICLGSQLLSKAAGGQVTRSPKPEIGWFNIELTEEGRRDPLFQGLPSRLEVYQWH
ncbi:MAG: type 1 glutamine amidotransferase, partial [Candidatus Omnitrophica bacterium]|nr:type 1 glutamine amidotransferase [Candidatus Omnitrophota bacterium]